MGKGLLVWLWLRWMQLLRRKLQTILCKIFWISLQTSPFLRNGAKVCHTWYATHGTPHMARHTWHATHGTPHMARHTWHVTHGTSHMVRHTWYVTHGTSHMVRHTWYVTHGTSHMVCHTRYVTHGMSHMVCHTWYVMRWSNQIILCYNWKLGGGGPVTLTRVTVPRKESTDASKRTLVSRSQQGKQFIKSLAGNTHESFAKQTALIVKSFDQESREKIMKNLWCKCPNSCGARSCNEVLLTHSMEVNENNQIMAWNI